MSNPEDDKISMLPSCSEDDEVSTAPSCPEADDEASALPGSHDNVDSSLCPTSSKGATEGLIDPTPARDASRMASSAGKEAAEEDQ